MREHAMISQVIDEQSRRGAISHLQVTGTSSFSLGASKEKQALVCW